jgi:hypothetical protein
MPHRNGNKPVVGPRPEVKRALTESTPRIHIPQVQESLRELVCQRPLASLAVAVLAGVGAGIFLGALGSMGAKR